MLTLKIGGLPFTGNGTATDSEARMTVEQLVAAREDTNCMLLQRLREDENAKELMGACCEDARLGRMTEPMPLRMEDATDAHFSPRFGVEQGSVSHVWL